MRAFAGKRRADNGQNDTFPRAGGAVRSPRFRPAAFTLVELLVSLAILAVIASLSFTSFQSINRIVDANRQNERAQRSVRAFVDRLDEELSGAVLVRASGETLFVSKREDIGGLKTNTLSFTTIAPQRYLEIGERDEIVKVEYRVERSGEDSARLAVKKRIHARLLTPYRESEPEPGPETGVAEFLIRDDFTGFSMRFFDGGKWYDGWDSRTTNLIPDGVELLFSIGDKTFRAYFNVFIQES